MVLTWPYKDCVLEGGMTNEERGRNEVFWNTTLSPDDITRLFEPKVFTGWERWDREAVAEDAPKPVGEVREDDNLLLKGNNLLVLHSLKARYAGKVKLIYIDPPYNTGNDGFRYNDKFNHSAWLTFMRNRLEVAKELLREDGAIFVNIDFNEVHYLKVLMDEVFGWENFQREIIWRIGWVSGFKTKQDNFVRNHDTILFYAKNKDRLSFNKIYIEKKDFNNRFNDNQIRELLTHLEKKGLSPQDAHDFLSLTQVIGLPDRYPIEDTWNCSIYDNLNSIAVMSFSGEKVSKLLGTDEFKGQKPEALLKRIIESTTEEGDLVLDFFVGTGTTAAVAQKLQRQYIGIEQMDSMKQMAIPRLKKVIMGDSVGISKKIDWQGGGGFVFAELAKSNSYFADLIESAPDTNALLAVYSNIQYSAFLRYDAHLSEFDISEFLNLPPHEAKRVLMNCLDANHFYVNLGSLGDNSFNISNQDTDATHSFYKIEK